MCQVNGCGGTIHVLCRGGNKKPQESLQAKKTNTKDLKTSTVYMENEESHSAYG